MGAKPTDGRIAIGYVGGIHGVRGEIVGCADDDSDILADLETLYVGETEYKVAQARVTPKGVLLRLEGLNDRNAAEALRSQPISANRDDLVEDDEDVLLQDMIGCRVVSVDGDAFGEVTGIEWGMQDRLVVLDDQVERLIPVVDELLVNIDIDNQLITVACGADWPSSPRRQGGRRDD